MKKVYIIMGSEGEYDSYNEWNVCAYLSKESAEKKLASLNKEESKKGYWNRISYDLMELELYE